MSEPRRYDEDETARILRRANEFKPLVPARVGQLARGQGITLEQLVEAAGEAGMEVEAVRRAAAELEAPEALRTSPFYGSPTRIVIERRIRRVVDPSEYDAFVDEIRRGFGVLGVATVTARAVSWSSLPVGAAATDGRRLSVSLVSREAGTILRVEEDLTPETAGYFGVGISMSVIGSFIAFAGLASSAAAAPLFVLVPAIPIGAYAGARKLFRRVHGRREDDLILLADRLAARAEEPIR